MVPLSAQVEQRRILATQKQLEEIKAALMGFAAANGRLPCPATNASNGAERFLNPPGDSPANGVCATFANGLLPATTLGLAPVDAQGFALDAWDARIRYAVSFGFPPAANAQAFTRTNGMRDAGINAIASSNLFYVCAADGGNPLNCGAATTLSSRAVVVIYSLGGNAAAPGGAGADELDNLDNDPVFVSHPRTATPGNAFDDLVTWIGPSLLLNRMIEAGQLP